MGIILVDLELRQKYSRWLIYAGIVAVTLAAYEPIRHNEFVSYDDPAYILNEPLVKSGFNLESIKQAFTKPHFFMWHLITTLSHMLDYRLFGSNPQGHHFVSVLIHIANALLLFKIFIFLTKSTWLSAFIAVIFALHPLQVESAAWASERKTILSGFFWFTTMAAYIYYTKKPGIRRYLLVLLAYGFCIMSKPTVVTLPFALLLLDFWPLERIEWGHSKSGENKTSIKWLIAEKIPLLAMASFLSIMTFVSQKAGAIVPTLAKMPLEYRFANMFFSYIRYIGKVIWPAGLPVYYPHPRLLFGDFPVILCAFLLILITAICLYLGRQKKYLLTGWFWYIGTLVPVIGLVQSGAQSMANRYMYIPILGLLIIIGGAIKDFIIKQPRAKIVLIPLAILALSTILVLTRMQVMHWQNSLTLFDYALKVSKDNPIAENGYGCALLESGRFDEAQMHLSNAVRISPIYTEAWNNLANVYIRQGKYDEAIACFIEIINQKQATAETYYNIAAALSLQNKNDEAIKYFHKSLDLNSRDPDTHKQMGITLITAGRINEAIEHLNESLRLNPNQPDVKERIKQCQADQNK